MPETQALPLGWAIATINPAEGEEGSSLASTKTTTDKAVKARTSAAAATTTATDESCARVAAVNDKAVVLD